MKVLFVQNIEGIAGSEKYFWQLLPALKKQGLDVEFLAVHKKRFSAVTDRFAQPLRDSGITVHAIATRSYISLPMLSKMKRLVKKGQYDILHTHLIYADFWGAVLTSFFGLKIKTVSTLHGYQEDIYTKFCLEPKKVPHNNYYRIAKFTYKRLDHVYACSKGLKDFFSAAGITTKQPVEVVHHGFDYAEISSTEERGAGFTCTIVGRLIPRKGHELVLKHCAKLAQSIPGFRLVVVGDGPLRESLEKIVKDQGVQHVVTFTGEVKDARNHMAGADLVLVPSYAEGLPLVIFEAMSVGRAVIAFETIGPAEAVVNNTTGLLIPPFNDIAFAEAIIYLASKKELREGMGKAGKTRVAEQFSLHAMTHKTIAFYQTCLK